MCYVVVVGGFLWWWWEGRGWLSINASHHYLKLHWLICSKTAPQKQIWTRQSTTEDIMFGVYLLVSDFLVESRKANKN